MAVITTRQSWFPQIFTRLVCTNEPWSLWLETEVNFEPFLPALCQPERKDVNLGIVEEESNPNKGSIYSRRFRVGGDCSLERGKEKAGCSLSIVPLSRWHRHCHGDHMRSLWLHPTPAISSCLPILDIQEICLDCRSSPVHISCPFPSSNLLLESLISSYVLC